MTRTMIPTKLQVLAGFIAITACMCPGLSASLAPADEPSVTNAQLETRPVAESLTATTQQLVQESAKPFWIGYIVEKVAGQRSICCGDHGDDGGIGCGTCTLENEHNYWSGTRHQNRTVNLEGNGNLVVLLRVDKKQVMRIRIASGDCTLDAGGLRFVWLTGAN